MGELWGSRSRDLALVVNLVWPSFWSPVLVKLGPKTKPSRTMGRLAMPVAPKIRPADQFSGHVVASKQSGQLDFRCVIRWLHVASKRQANIDELAACRSFVMHGRPRSGPCRLAGAAALHGQTVASLA